MVDVTAKVGLEVDESELKKVSSKVSNSIGNTGGTIGTKLGGGLVSAFSGLIGPLGASLATAFAFKKIISEASEFESQVNRLNSSLRLAGSFSKDASQDFQKFATEIQNTTTFGDGLTLELSALALNFAKTNEQARSLTKAALDLSVATGQDASSALRQLGATFDGTAGRLSKLVPELKALTSEQLRAGGAIDIVAKRFDGAAKDEVKTFSGATTQLSNNVGDLAKQLGLLVTKQESTISFINAISKGFGDAANLVDLFRRRNENSVDILNLKLDAANSKLAQSEDLLKKVNAAGGSFEIAGSGVSVTAEQALDFVKRAREEIQLLEEDRRRAAKGPVVSEGASPEVFLTPEELKAREDSLRAFNNLLVSSQAAAIDSQSKFNDTFLSGEQLKESQRILLGQQTEVLTAQQEERISQARIQFLETGLINQAQFAVLQQAIVQDSGNKIALINEEFRTKFEMSNQSFSETFAKTAASMAGTADDLQKNISKGLINGLVGGFKSVGAALANGENAFDAFGRAVLGTLGELMVQWGTYMLLTALGLNFIPGFQSVKGSVPFGLALITLGGALSALSGSGGGGKSSIPGGSGSSFSQSSIDEPTFDQDQIEGQQSRLTVNIQGDVLDSQQSALRIVELIREATDNQGADLRFA